MGRKSKSDNRQAFAIGFFAVGVISISKWTEISDFIVKTATTNSINRIAEYIALFLIACAVYILLKRFWADKKVSDIIIFHIESLCTERLKLVRIDEFGKEDHTKWDTKIDYFIDKIVAEKLSDSEFRYIDEKREEVAFEIESKVLKHSKSNSGLKSFHLVNSDREFEIFCADQLKTQGWNARVTQQSGDQGVDVVAVKNGKKLVLQCKLYSGTVGNDAVQQISAGRLHERADYAGVVCKTEYTRSAKQLAKTNHVLLMHYTQLSSIDRLLEQIS